jgi:hypothetical protein
MSRSRNTKNMAVVCAWCKKEIKPGTYPASHTICRDCYFEQHGVWPEDEDDDEDDDFENRKRNMSPTRRMPRVAMDKRELARRIISSLDHASAKLNTAKYHLTLLEKLVGDTIDDSMIEDALLDIQRFAKWIYDEFGE